MSTRLHPLKKKAILNQIVSLYYFISTDRRSIDFISVRLGRFSVGFGFSLDFCSLVKML